MKETDEIVALRETDPELFGCEPRSGLLAVEKHIAKAQARIRALGLLRRSYRTRLNRSPLAQIAKEAKEQERLREATPAAANPSVTIAPQKQEPSLSEPRLATQQEMDDMIAELSGLMPRAE